MTPRLAVLALEISAWLVAALVAVIAWLGSMAAVFIGADVWTHLLPFAASVLALALLLGALLALGLPARRWLAQRIAAAPAAVATVVAAGALWAAWQPGFGARVEQLRVLVGGPVEAERAAVAHQVFAAYRRTNLAAMKRTLERAQRYEPIVRDAASAFGVDAEVLMGIAVAESSFRPRDSPDGGRGLFQITAPPADAVESARAALDVGRLELRDHRHNAYLGAATLRRYLDQMNGDLFLALLAYNIGPRNGGLHSILASYHARDFVTIQPYLQNLPRDYPIRVLAAALAYRVLRTQGELLRYEEGDNARRIQAIGVPGLDGWNAAGCRLSAVGCRG